MAFHLEPDDLIGSWDDLVQESQLQWAYRKNDIGSEASAVNYREVRLTFSSDQISDEVAECSLLGSDA